MTNYTEQRTEYVIWAESTKVDNWTVAEIGYLSQLWTLKEIFVHVIIQMHKYSNIICLLYTSDAADE